MASAIDEVRSLASLCHSAAIPEHEFETLKQRVSRADPWRVSNLGRSYQGIEHLTVTSRGGRLRWLLVAGRIMEGAMAATSIRNVSRRGVLLGLGAGLAAGVLGRRTLPASAAAGTSPPAAEADEVNMNGVGLVQAASGGTVVARMADGNVYTAALVGFPATVLLRAGDLVAVDTGTVSTSPAVARCAPASISDTTPPITAHPLCRWTIGTPLASGDGAVVGAVHLASSPALTTAVKRRAQVAVCTLDTTLADHLVLSIQPA